MKKINNLIAAIPMSMTVGILIILGFISGSMTAKINLLESEIVKGFTKNLLMTMAIVALVIVTIDLFLKVMNKSLRNRLINKVYLDKLDLVSNSKMSDINKITSGKIFGLTQEIASLKAGLYGDIIWMACAIPPFMTLMYKETLYDVRMVLISLSSLVVTTTMVLISDKLFGWSTEGQKKKSHLSGVTADNFGNIRTIKSLKQTMFGRKRLVVAQQDLLPYAVNIPHITYFRIMDILCMLPLFLNIIIARNDIEMMAFIIISDYTMMQIRGFVSDICEIIVEIKGCENNLKDLDGSDTVVPPTLVDTLVLDNVIFDYGNEDEKFVIEHIEFPYKSRTLIHGSSGSGKSSLANLISGGIKPTTGNVPSYNCYYIWQETESLADTLWNNIVFDNEHNIPENEIIELFKELNMFEWFCKLDKGFDTFIGEKGCRLSSGQKQRLNIIRLVLTMRYRPDYLFIIDEITSNLDDHTRELAIKLIDRECKSTLICISHNEGFDKICNHSIEVTLDHRFIVES